MFAAGRAALSTCPLIDASPPETLHCGSVMPSMARFAKGAAYGATTSGTTAERCGSIVVGSFREAVCYFNELLILLCHKRRRFVCRVQQGQRERFRAMATISLRRIVAIEFGM